MILVTGPVFDNLGEADIVRIAGARVSSLWKGAPPVHARLVRPGTAASTDAGLRSPKLFPFCQSEYRGALGTARTMATTPVLKQLHARSCPSRETE